MEYTLPSKKIQDFLSKNISLPDFHFSQKALPVIQNIYKQAVDAHATTPNYSVVSKKIAEKDTPFPKGTSYEYMDDSIKTHIEGLKKQITEVELIVQKRTYTIFFIIPEKTANNIDKYVKKINTWLQLATLYAKPSCSKSVNVYLYLTDLTKTLPKKQKNEINSEHANTAFTTSCQPNTEIILYRREEWFKVFIHESFHNLGLDFAGHTVKQVLSDIFPIQSDFKLYETYTEMWAELLNIIFINVETNNHNLEKHIQMEQKFSFFQTAKILNHFGMTYSDFFSKDASENYKEDTEIFCYYVLKTLLLYNCNSFIEWLSEHQKPVPNKVNKFIKDLIIPKYNEIKFVETIDKIQQEQEPNFINNTLIGSTMRMTALEQLL